MRERRLLLAAPRDRVSSLAELVAAWGRARIHVEHVSYEADVPDVAALVARSAVFDAALLVGPARRAPATIVSGPFTVDGAGRRVPIGVVPATSPSALRRFARTAARVHERPRSGAAVALLGQWHPQYLRIVDRMEALVGARSRAFRWTSDVITREGLVDALGTGLGLAVYVGHGRPSGWTGYYGMRRRHFDGFAGEPLGALFSLCCRTASRRRIGLSYSESLPLAGVAAATFGATTDTLHTDNTRWAVALCDALASGVSNVGELVVRAAPLAPTAIAPYRIVGDPLAPLTAARGALARAEAVQVFP